ncbi:MAG: T9SS type A sorting domain-containing protein [Bacteroidia bacterium]|nr:T9SS type A sorting domain-containing protein [Bacteroidia bacterium]
MRNFLLAFGIFLSLTTSAQVSIGISVTNVTCNSSCDGTATATPTGGTPPYTYSWAPAMMTTATATGLCPGTYTVTVTDSNAGTATQTCVITQPTMLSTGIVPPPSTICSGSTVTINANPIGGTPPYACNWVPMTYVTSTMGCSMTCQPLTGITYTLTVTDANGCVAFNIVSLNVTNGPAISSYTVTPATCNQSNGSIAITAPGALTYSWVPGNTTNNPTFGLISGTSYTCTVGDANGCTTTGTGILMTDSCDYVWPGDANDDAVADNVDILDIGIANGATGTTRPNASLTWIGQPSTPWGQTLLSGTDYKWVDCNGDGTISLIDTQAVVLNYGQTHTNRVLPPDYNASVPDLRISFAQDSIAAGSTGTITLSLGDAVLPASNVYGIAFRLNYDAAQISTSSIGMQSGTTWFGTIGGNAMQVVLHPSPSNGFVDVALTRVDQQNVSGNGTIGTFYFTATTAMTGTGNATDVPVTISNVTVVDNSGAAQSMNVIGDTLTVADPPLITTLDEINNPTDHVYPTQSSDIINVNVSGTRGVVNIMDLSGRMISTSNVNTGRNTINVNDLPAGNYILQILHDNGAATSHMIQVTE